MSEVDSTQKGAGKEADKGAGKGAGTRNGKGGIFGLEGLPKIIVLALGWIAALILIAVVGAWLWALWQLHNRVAESDLNWARLLSLFGFLHSVASGVIGALFGVAIQQGKVAAANEQAAYADSRAIVAETTANTDKADASLRIAQAQHQTTEAINLVASTSKKLQLGTALASAVLTEAAHAAPPAAELDIPGALNLRAPDRRALKIAEELLAMD